MSKPQKVIGTPKNILIEALGMLKTYAEASTQDLEFNIDKDGVSVWWGGGKMDIEVGQIQEIISSVQALESFGFEQK